MSIGLAWLGVRDRLELAGELSQWTRHDDSNITVALIIVVIILR